MISYKAIRIVYSWSKVCKFSSEKLFVSNVLLWLGGFYSQNDYEWFWPLGLF